MSVIGDQFLCGTTLITFLVRDHGLGISLSVKPKLTEKYK